MLRSETFQTTLVSNIQSYVKQHFPKTSMVIFLQETTFNIENEPSSCDFYVQQTVTFH